ncbi:hypothetical protein LEP1GSC178_3450 [Leptospira licerasiae str. MMD4847]|uniref:AraC family transcriptional regulator n=1 Tax=Leptospira licerasiae str. MMD4847 TaxID=1049971 RepID=A0ABP2RK62_9LEPT|nr:hypothetical protein LEP1GSC178_3450 [Leptospira licerasiae str. MMD4847]
MFFIEVEIRPRPLSLVSRRIQVGSNINEARKTKAGGILSPGAWTEG